MARRKSPPPPPTPGQVLREWLAEAGHTQAWLAGRLTVSQKHVNEIICDRGGFSVELAVRLAHVTRTEARYWLDLQASHKLEEARR